MEFVMNEKESDLIRIREMLIDIQMSLCASNNTVTTDNVDAKEDSLHWRINHNESIKQVDQIANLLNINLCSSPRCSDGGQSERGVIPLGTKIYFGYNCSFILEHDLEVNVSQEKINKKIGEGICADSDLGRLHIRADYKKKLESRDLSQREREVLSQAIVYEPDLQVLKSLKKEFESKGLSQQDLDVLSNVIECQSGKQA